MNKLAPLALAATLVTFTLAPAAVYAAETSQSVSAPAEAAAVSVNAGKMIYGPNGQRIAPAYRVTSEGAVQVILNGKLVNIPSSTLSDVNGKVTTSLSKKDLTSAR